MQEALLTIKKKYGKNAVLRGMNFEEGATPPRSATGRSGDIRRRWKLCLLSCMPEKRTIG